MKFPVKSIKEGTSIPVSVNPVFRKEFLSDMPNNSGTRVRGIDIELINEALRAIDEGTAKINGKTPKTRIERFIVISSYFQIAKTKSYMSYDGVLDDKHNCTVSIKHNDQAYSFAFPEKISQN
jgi:hypothetical protein